MNENSFSTTLFRTTSLRHSMQLQWKLLSIKNDKNLRKISISVLVLLKFSSFKWDSNVLTSTVRIRFSNSSFFGDVFCGWLAFTSVPVFCGGFATVAIFSLNNTTVFSIFFCCTNFLVEFPASTLFYLVLFESMPSASFFSTLPLRRQICFINCVVWYWSIRASKEDCTNICTINCVALLASCLMTKDKCSLCTISLQLKRNMNEWRQRKWMMMHHRLFHSHYCDTTKWKQNKVACSVTVNVVVTTIRGILMLRQLCLTKRYIQNHIDLRIKKRVNVLFTNFQCDKKVVIVYYCCCVLLV